MDLGLVIRARRRKLGLSQTELAHKAGVGRQWNVSIERGKPRAEFGLLLRTLSALDLSLATDAGERLPRPTADTVAVDIDAVIRNATRDRK